MREINKKRNILGKNASLRVRLSSISRDLAIENIDIAEKFLQDLLTVKPENYAEVMFPEKSYTEQESRKMYASELNSATMFLHLNIWDYRVGIHRTHENFVPLLQQAASKIFFRGKYFKQIRGFINRKIGDLEKKYCQGVFLIKQA